MNKKQKLVGKKKIVIDSFHAGVKLPGQNDD